MKQLTTYNRAAAYLNNIFDLLNARYFEGALSRPIITIQSTPKAYGHYTLYDAWSVDGDKGMREINIGAGTLSRPIENVVATLLHEMVHYWNDTNGIKDASRGNTYHNKNFKAKAEACDLLVEHPELIFARGAVGQRWHQISQRRPFTTAGRARPTRWTRSRSKSTPKVPRMS